MKTILKTFLQDFNTFQKLILILTFFMPFALLLSVFAADLICTLIGLLFITIFIKERKSLNIFDNLKFPLILFLLFYIIIIISLIDSVNFKLSFTPSFFYFRFFLMIMGILYILKHHDLTQRIILYSLIIIFAIIFIDSAIQYNFKKNIFGYNFNVYCPPQDCVDSLGFITSFFDDEKKLGSFVVRILPFLLSLIVYNDIQIFKKYHLINIIVFASIVLIFYTTERTALIMFIVFFIFFIKLVEHKFKILGLLLILLISFYTINQGAHDKLVNGTLAQLNIIKSHADHTTQKKNFGEIKYYSQEHQDLAITAINIFKQNPFTGAGIKSYRTACNKTNYKNYVCTTHPHSTYPQLLSEIGFFGFAIVVFVFFYILIQNIKIFFNKDNSINKKSLYLLNIGIIINLMPFIPSGSFFNNWISLLLFYPIPFWFYLSSKIKKSS